MSGASFAYCAGLSVERAAALVPRRGRANNPLGYLPRTPAQYESGEQAVMIGPNNSGRRAASIMIAQPA
jgi:hypothetical protein